jgi:hypothetical protein
VRRDDVAGETTEEKKMIDKKKKGEYGRMAG